MNDNTNPIQYDVEESDMKMLSKYASQLYQYGDYEGAKRIFYLLVRVDQWNGDYFFSLAQCYQHCGEHEEALFCFSRSGQINIEDPRSAYLAGKSYLALNNNVYAKRSFEAAIRVCNCLDDDLWNNIKISAQKELDLLKGDNQ